jgi:cytochrome b pre-mRNA-processing protein 3
MLRRWKDKRDLRQRAGRLYEAVSHQARQPALFMQCAVPDTVEGRFEMVALHLVLVLNRLGRLEPDQRAAGDALAQATTETFATAMDDTMRAVGVGDLIVPRKVKQTAAALYDRHQAYGRVLASAPAEQAALWNIALDACLAIGKVQPGTDISALSAYAVAAAQALARWPTDQLLAGHLPDTQR